jgi:hypothetical protein
LAWLPEVKYPSFFLSLSSTISFFNLSFQIPFRLFELLSSPSPWLPRRRLPLPANRRTASSASDLTHPPTSTLTKLFNSAQLN